MNAVLEVLEGLDGVLCHMDDVLYLDPAKKNMIYDSRLLSSGLRRQELPSIQANMYLPLITSSFLVTLLTRLGYKQTQPRHPLFFRWMLLPIYQTYDGS